MTCEINDISTRPYLHGSAGLFARPSVMKLSVERLSTTAVSSRQPAAHSGFPSGEPGKKRKCTAIPRVFAVVRSTTLGFAPRAVKHFDSAYHLRFFDSICSTSAIRTRAYARGGVLVITGPFLRTAS